MSKKMYIDASHAEETRVVVVAKGQVEDFDFESQAKKSLRGNIYLARVTRVEPSLQAAFVEYGGNRHGFLAFSEIHPDYYQIPVSDRETLQQAADLEAELTAELDLIIAEREEAEQDARAQRRPLTTGPDPENPPGADIGPEDEGDEFAPDEITGPDKKATPPAPALLLTGADLPRLHHDEERSASADPDMTDDQPEAAYQEDPPGSAVPAHPENIDNAADIPPSPVAFPPSPQTGHPEDQIATPDAEEFSGAEEIPDAGRADDAGSADQTEKAEAFQQETSDPEEADTSEDTDTFDDTDTSDDTDTADKAAIMPPASDDIARRGGKTTSASRARETEIENRLKDARRDRAALLRNYRIQEVIKRRQILLIQVVKEERGNKGAAVTTYLSLAGRYGVLMPNTAKAGGISRKISNATDRRRLRKAVAELDVPKGIGLIIRTAGAKRTKSEIKRDYDYLIRLWHSIRDLTIKSIAPSLIYEEASLIKRAIRDMYDKDTEVVRIEGEAGYREAKDFMKMLMPSHAKHIQPHKKASPLFLSDNVESQLDEMYQPIVKLQSGGYLVIQQTEALISIDVNSGRATAERNIEATALKTNLEAAREVARQCRLRDLAGLVVIDFIDMEENRNNRAVEKKIKEAMKTDRARIQIGRISAFGLMELSRQRRRSGIVDGTTQLCPTCSGAGAIRSVEMAAMRIIRAIEADAVTGKAGLLTVKTSLNVAMFILNSKRAWLDRIEINNGVVIEITAGDMIADDVFEIEKKGSPRPVVQGLPAIQADLSTDGEDLSDDVDTDSPPDMIVDDAGGGDDATAPAKRRKKRQRKGRSAHAEAGPETGNDRTAERQADIASETLPPQEENQIDDIKADDDERARKRRRRGRRGGKKTRKASDMPDTDQPGDENQSSEAGDHASQDAAAPPPDNDDASPREDNRQEDPPRSTPRATRRRGSKPESGPESEAEAESGPESGFESGFESGQNVEQPVQSGAAATRMDASGAGDTTAPAEATADRAVADRATAAALRRGRRRSSAPAEAQLQPHGDSTAQTAQIASPEPVIREAGPSTAPASPSRTDSPAQSARKRSGWWQRALKID